MALNYQERQAFDVIRRAMRSKPEIATALVEGMTKDVVVSVMVQIQRELADLHAVTRAFVNVAQTLTDLDKKEPK